MPSITQLEYIVAVDRLRHFGKAAKACHITQPSLSMQIQKEEAGFGDGTRRENH
jgi:LysR family transcriptional regulator, hydrogen peroxide-inducible genes activator